MKNPCRASDTVEKNEIKEDTTYRLQKTMEVIQSIASGDFNARAEVTTNVDIIDALATGVNMLAEELEFGTIGLEFFNNRIDHILEIIQRCARGDYQYCEVSMNNDSFDGLCMGLNMLIDDINENIKKDKQRVSELEMAYQELRQTQHASLNIMEDLDRQGKELSVINKQLQQEIKERKHAEERLEQTVNELKRSNTDLEQFIKVAYHDLQEPLRMVSSYAKLLERRYKGKLDADADDYIGYAVEGVDHMHRLINDLLMYVNTGTQNKPFEPIDFKKIMNNAVANLHTAIKESGAVITYDPLPIIMADNQQLLQLLKNMLNNAIKFHGNKPPRVHISAQPKENEWLFSVRDNGIGIDPEFSDRIFTIFQRLHSRNEYPGTGIGLAICKKIIENHGGRIWVESEPGKGSIFYFTIPNRRGEQS